MKLSGLIIGNAELLMGVRDLQLHAAHDTVATSVSGYLTIDERHFDNNGFAAGGLGVLIDVVSGYAMAEDDAHGRRTVSTVITLDLLAAPKLGDELRAVGTVRQTEQVRAAADGTVTDQNGRLVATFLQHGHFVDPHVSGARRDASQRKPNPSAGLSELLGVTAQHQPGELSITVGEHLLNPRGHQHGGITLAIADLAGRAATSQDCPVVTGSVQVLYQRPVASGATLSVSTSVEHHGRFLRSARVTGVIGEKDVFQARVVTWPAY